MTLSENVGICAGGADEGPRKCDDEIERMTPQAVCEAVQAKKKNIWDAVGDIASAAASTATAIYAPWVPMLDSLTSTADITTDLQTKMNINIDTSTFIDQNARCDILIDQIQENVIKGIDKECINAWVAAGYTTKEIRKMSDVKVGNITQINTAEAKAECAMNMAIEALSQMDASIDNLAMQEALAESKGLLAKTTVNQNICNAINTNMSACKYIKQQMCCASQVQQIQKNLLDLGCQISGSFKDITQTNNAKVHASCQASAASTVTDQTSAGITNKITQIGTAKATGLDMSWIVLIVVVVIVGGIAGKYFMSKKKKEDPPETQSATQQQAAIGGKYTRTRGRKSEDASGAMNIFFRVAGVLEVIAGIVCIILYITTHTKSLGPVIDKPFVQCEQTQIIDSEFKDSTDDPHFDVNETIDLMSSGIARSTFGQIKEKSLKDSGIIGYDFFPDDISINPKDIPDNQRGLGVFLSHVDTEDREKYQCRPINTEEERSVSMIYEKSNILLIILGIVLVIGGIIQTVLTFR